MGIHKYLKISISIIFSFSLLAFCFPAAAQVKVLQCSPGKATIRNDLQVGIDTDPGNLMVSGNSFFSGNASFGPNGSKPYVKDNAGSGLLFYSQGGQNFLWQSGSGNPGADAMVLGGVAANAATTDNGFNLQVYGNLCLTDGCRSTWPSGGSGNWTLSGSNISNNNTGNVGIGTTGPQVPLHVAGTITAPSSSGVPNGSVIVGGSTTGVQMAMGVTADITPQYGWIQPRYSNNSSVYNLALNPNGGNVGIGTITPGAKLEVAGQIKITGGTPAAGKVLTSDAVGLASWTTPANGLPAGTAGQTLRHDGTNWTASNALLNGGTNIEIQNQIKIAGGSPGAGKVLTSDAAGLASWQTITTGKNLFKVSGTFVVPSGVTRAWITMSGGGGGGGGSSVDSGSGAKGGGGGGGGSSIMAQQVAVIPGNSMTVTVGTGGIGGYISPMAITINSTNGGSSSFGTLSVSGGTGGGHGAFPSTNNNGGNGASRGTKGTTSNINLESRGGTGGGSIFGIGGLGGGLVNGNGRYGDDGSGYGAGGGGSGYTIFASGLFYGGGGQGSGGFVLVEW